MKLSFVKSAATACGEARPARFTMQRRLSELVQRQLRSQCLCERTLHFALCRPATKLLTHCAVPSLTVNVPESPTCIRHTLQYKLAL